MCSSVAFAGNMVSDVEIVVMVNDYKPIEVKDLPQAVQDTIKKDFADLTIKVGISLKAEINVFTPFS